MSAILFRMLIYVVSVFLMGITGTYENPLTMNDFLAAWTRWDGYAYLRIAEGGYAGNLFDGQYLDVVFYPLYPWLIRIVAVVFRNYQLSGLLISTICYGLGCVYFDKLLTEEYGEEVSKNALILLSAFPFAFFFGAIMTESLFFFLLAAFLYYLRKHAWFQCALVGFFLCMTKVQGMLLTLAVIAELFYSYHGFRLIKEGKWKQFGKDIILNGLKCVPMVGGILIYLLVNYLITGNAFMFMTYQKSNWHNGLYPIWETISYVFDYVKGGWYTSTGMSLWVPEFLLFFVYIIVIAYSFNKKMRPAYLTYFVTFFILTYSSSWLISGGRYTLSALPMFMAGGIFISEHPRWKMPLCVLSYSLMMVYMTGYYLGKQIM